MRTFRSVRNTFDLRRNAPSRQKRAGSSVKTVIPGSFQQDPMKSPAATSGQKPFFVSSAMMVISSAPQTIAICAGLESEIAELDDDEKILFLEELGISESGLDKLVKASYSLLDLISFLTAGEDECRAWTIRKGTKAPQAAGKIHTDFERGFIRAETIAYDKFIEAGGSISAAREKGWLRSEGKEYVMQDGDIVNFLFNV